MDLKLAWIKLDEEDEDDQLPQHALTASIPVVFPYYTSHIDTFATTEEEEEPQPKYAEAKVEQITVTNEGSPNIEIDVGHYIEPPEPKIPEVHLKFIPVVIKCPPPPQIDIYGDVVAKEPPNLRESDIAALMRWLESAPAIATLKRHKGEKENTDKRRPLLFPSSTSPLGSLQKRRKSRRNPPVTGLPLKLRAAKQNLYNSLVQGVFQSPSETSPPSPSPTTITVTSTVPKSRERTLQLRGSMRRRPEQPRLPRYYFGWDQWKEIKSR